MVAVTGRKDDATAATRQDGPGARTVVDQPRDADDDSGERLAHGTRVGRYVVLHTLGAGGMGVVYAAHDPELDRRVAIKLLQARPGGSETGGQTWLLREAQAMARLAHPNVVAVYDVGAIPGDRVFVAMELVEGATLRHWLKTPRTWREVLAIMRAAGAGLAAAHAAGLVHRDFKPDNVLVGGDGRARVMDFGLARLGDGPEHPPSGDARSSDLSIEARSPLSEPLTIAGTVLGTPAYIAPEIYGGSSRADARADQFAFGVALYEALYRERPFDRTALVEGRATPPRPRARAVERPEDGASDRPGPGSSYGGRRFAPPVKSRVPAWLERVTLRAISLDPAQRFATMDELLAALAADPGATRRRVAIGAAVALACGGGFAVALAVTGGGEAATSDGSASTLCTGAEGELAGVWDASRRTAVAKAFRTVARPFVDEALRGTETTLDAYAASWVAMRTDACKATRVSGHQTEDVLALRMQCLDVRLAELKGLGALLEKADEALVRGAVTTAQKLAPIADCADTAALTAADPLPRDEAARARVVAVRAKLAEARATYKATRPRDALAIVEQLAPELAQLAHKPTEAELHFLLGQTRWVTQGADKGEPELLEATLAAEAGKADALVVEAWQQLANLAIEQNRFDVASDRLHRTTGALARLGKSGAPGSADELRVRVIASEALLALRRSKHAEAIAAMARAREIADKRPDSPTYAYALLVEATILNAAARPAEALANFKKVVAFHEKLGRNRLEVVSAIQSMATAEAQLGHVPEALAHSVNAVEITESIYGPDSVEAARALGTLGAVQAMNNELAAALATDKRALELVARTAGENDELYASTLGQLAGVLVALERHKEALPYLQRAEAIQTAKLGPGHVQTLSIVITLCDAQRAAKDLRAAVATCKRALAAGEKSLGRDNPILFLFLAHLGDTLIDARQPRDAAAALERALVLGANDPSDIFYVSFLAARAHWAAGNKPRALALGTKARDGFASLGDAKKEQHEEAVAWLRGKR